MLCNNCGEQITGGNLLCEECGAEQVREQSKDSSYVALQANAIEDFRQVSRQQYDHQMTTEEEQSWFKDFERQIDSSRFLLPLLLLGGAVVIFLIANWFQSLVNSSMFSMTYDAPEKFSGIFLALLAEITFWGGWVLSVVCVIGGVIGLVARDQIVWKQDLNAPVSDSKSQDPAYHPQTPLADIPESNAIVAASIPAQNAVTDIPEQNQPLINSVDTEQSNSFDDEQTVTMSRAVVEDIRCSSCGEGILDTERFCTSCGMPIREHVKKDTATLAAEREATEREAVEKAAAVMAAIEGAAEEERAAVADRVTATERAATAGSIRDDSDELGSKAEKSDIHEEAPVKSPPTLRVKIKKRR